MQERRQLSVLIWIVDSNNQTATDRRDTFTNQNWESVTLIVPTIAAPLKNVMQTHIAQLPHLQEISLAHPVTRPVTNFEISLLIGADNYSTGTLSRITSFGETAPQQCIKRSGIYCQGHYHHNRPLH